MASNIESTQERDELVRICNKVQDIFVQEKCEWPVVMSTLTNVVAANIVAMTGYIPGQARGCSNMFAQQVNEAITQKIAQNHVEQNNSGGSA